MSADGTVSNRSRLSNGTYPASNGSGPLSPDSESGASEYRPDVPTVEERVRGILKEYPDRVLTPIAREHGTKVRADVLEDPEVNASEVEVGDHETRTVEEIVSRDALPWIAVIEEFLRDYEGYRDRYLRLAKGLPGEDCRESFTVSLYNSFAPEYQRKQYARLKAMKRQFIGEDADDSPTGETVGGAFEDPTTVLLGLTSSSTTETGGYRPPVGHDREIRDAWGGGDGVRRTLRYVLEDRLGLSSDEYAWWFQSEPHPGGGAASAYSHAHPVVILDESATGAEVTAETFRAVVAKHVSECGGAGWEAHRLEDAVTVKDADEIQDFAGYVSEYLSVDPDEDLLERSDEYIMWAATQWATTTQKYSKSRTATAAIAADACHQQYRDSETRQDADHGERVCRSDRRGVEFECAECGSEFGVSQEAGTLVEARLAVADGGTGVAEQDADETPQTLRSRWPSARGAAVVGGPTRERQCDHGPGADACPLCASETEAPNHTVSGEVPIPGSASAPPGEDCRESFVRAPSWRPEAIVQRATGEETEIGEPGGVEYGTVVVEGVGSVADRTGRTLLPEWLEGPEPWSGSPVSEEEVRSGEVPPPELVHKEYAERCHSDRRVTAKEWREDWYARRFEQCGGSAGSVVDESAVRRLAERGESVPAILGALDLPPSAVEEVEEVVRYQ